VLSLILSMVLYVIAGKLGWVRGVGTARTAQPELETDATPDAVPGLGATN
jgi:cytosine permease